MRRGGGTPSLDPDAAAYISAVETADGEALEEGVKTAINDFVSGCKSDAIWGAIKASCIMAGARTISGALVPLVGDAPTNVNFVSADYDRKTGLKGDRSTKYLLANINYNDMEQNSISFSVNLSDAGTSGTNRVHIGGSYASNSLDYNDIIADSTGKLASRNRLGASDLFPSPASETTGFLCSSRNNSADFIFRFGGVNNTVTRNSATPRDSIFSIYNRTNAALYSDARINFYHVGDYVDPAALDARTSALMTALDGAIA
jgi:hypothetical protein